jgi:glycosyltransferase involved in cell wall biosynthesis
MPAIPPQTLLTIAIPTYNRAVHLDAQLQWAVASINGRWEQCQLLVSDNASADQTQAVCEKWRARLGDRLHLVRQPNNLGLAGNIAFCINHAAGEYVWTVSDDDVMRPDAVTTVLATLGARPELAFLHMNFRYVHAPSGRVTEDRLYKHEEDRYASPALSLVEECLLSTDEGIMFMSVNVMKRALAVASLSQWPEAARNIALPMYLAAYVAARGPMALLAEPVCDAMTGRPSWEDRDVAILFKEIPEIYRQMIKLGYDRRVMNRLIRKRLKLEFAIFKALAKFLLKFPFEFARTLPYYVSAIKD